MRTRAIFAGVLSLTVLASGNPARADDGLARALAKVARARELTPAALAGAVRIGASLGDVVPARVAVRRVEAPPGVPAALRAPVSRLLTGVAAAEAAIARAVPRDRALAARARELMANLNAVNARAADVAERARELEAMAARVDRPVLFGGALALAEAIDAAVPLLRRADAARTAAATEGCDVYDDGRLCIGGDGDNLFTQDRALLIDLGGNDVHRHSAGGAHGPFGMNGLAVSVTVDLSGRDRYESASGQGAGSFGIGILVDGGGDDTYRGDGYSSAGQGFGSLGVGILADASGNDVYELLGDGVGGESSGPSPSGQGFAFIGSLGLALDGGGNDRWTMRSTIRPRVEGDTVFLGAGSILGHGFGSAGGVGVVADEGGIDDVALVVESAGEIPPHARGADAPGGIASILGGGYGLIGGAGIAYRGPGDTRWTARAAVAGPVVGTAWVSAFGRSQMGAVGAVVDDGGDDRYELHARAEATARAEPAASCCDAIVASARTAETIGSIVEGLGWGLLGGHGFVLDGGGDDLYSMRSESRATAIAEDARAGFPHASIAAIANASIGEANASGIAYGNGGGIGLVEDAGGDDSYETILVQRSEARATAADPGAATQSDAFADAGRIYTQGIGILGGHGELQDLGGADGYRSSGVVDAVASEGGTATVGGALEAFAQGAGVFGGSARLVDLGLGADAFVSEPHRAPCAGDRGGAAWVDCGNTDGAATGFNP